ncbi:hypothetical protein CJF31_00006467 [Rutstroemia sp. NJR-2017a BVV2]|nr:hypothetical protein CJF31_00006467 [Rutstroemia sp. NJR-2017a BVV2]
MESRPNMALPTIHRVIPRKPMNEPNCFHHPVVRAT